MNMATAINTHEYKEAINKHQSFIRTGTNKLLWGLLEWPQGYYHEEITHLQVCSRCGEEELTPIHGYVSVDKYTEEKEQRCVQSCHGQHIEHGEHCCMDRTIAHSGGEKSNKF